MRSPLDSIEVVFNRATVLLAALVAISIGLIALLIPLNLFLVKTHLGSIWWLFEGVEYSLYFGLFLGAPWVMQQGAHVKVDVLTTALPEQSAKRLEKFLDSAGLALCIEYEGRAFRSLTSVAYAITGGHRNGPRFFGLREMAS